MRYLNAHCHLELGFLRGAIPPGLSFVEWLRRLVPMKRAASAETVAAAVRDGLSALAAGGTETVLDIVSLPAAAGEINAPVRRFRFLELIDFDALTAEETFAGVADRLRAGVPGSFGWSPHAPYTTTAALVRAAVRSGERLCIHAAETPEETQLLAEDRGELRDYFDSFHAAKGWRAPMLRPIAWLDACGALGSRTMLAHLNDVTDEEIRLLAARGVSAVVCPGTHVYFGRGAFPLGRLLEGGVRCHLGTDSLASNETLDMEREVLLAQELTPGIDRDRIRRLADAATARAQWRSA